MLEMRSCHARRWRWSPPSISCRSTGRHSSTSSAKVVLARSTRSIWLMFKPDDQAASMFSRIASRSSFRMFGAANSRLLSGSLDNLAFLVEPRTSAKVRARSLTLGARAVAVVMRPSPHSGAVCRQSSGRGTPSAPACPYRGCCSARWTPTHTGQGACRTGDGKCRGSPA